MKEVRCTKAGEDMKICDALLGHDMGMTFRRPDGSEIAHGPTWCPACQTEYYVRRYSMGSGWQEKYRIALRPRD